MKVTALEGVVPAVFDDREQAEAAIEELREIGFSDDELGVMVPDPEHYHLMDNSLKEVMKGLGTGGAVGAPLGALAGLGVAGLLIPGLGVVGVGGALLWGGLGGAIWGTYLGAQIGMAVEIIHISDIERRYEIPLKQNQILIVVVAANQSEKVCQIMESHGAHCFWER
jgi:hypothetical protein